MSDPGQYRTRLSHYRPVNSKSQGGAPLKKLELLRRPWAKLEAQSQSASDSGERTQAVNRYRLETSLRPGINLQFDDWVYTGKQWLHVIAIDDTDPNRLVLFADCETNPSEPPPPLVE